ncbi:MAG TPA: hypothetical protein VGB15_21760 [Longimicrobium sp.]
MAEEPGWVDALLGPRGRELLERLAGEPLTRDAEIRVITQLRGEYPAELVTAAVTQAKLRARARAKFARADHMLFTADGLEQASTEAMSRNHARRYAGVERVADLCCGIGGELISLAANSAVLAVDYDPVHIRLACFNAEANGVGGRVDCVQADVREVGLDGIGAAFVDPARRAGGKRLGPGASDPPLEWCFALAERMPVGIKASPALPLELVPPGWEVEFASEHGELKESVLWSPALATTGRRATLLPDGHTLVREEGDEVPVRAPGGWLLDPDPAVTRSGAVEALARSLGVWKIDEQIAFLSGDAGVRTPFARTLKIEASAPWNLKHLRQRLREMDIGTVDIRKRGSAVDVDEVHRKLKLAGSRAATVVLTRVADRPWMLVCTDPPPG